MYQPVIFREYDIRGVFNEQFDLDFAYDLGRSFVTYLEKKGVPKNPKIVLGHDARLSGPAIKAALSKGLQDSGAHVIYVGLVTSPITYYATFEDPSVGGAMMVTGSHNPPEYNGFKVCVGNQTIFGDEIQALLKVMESKNYVSGKGSEVFYDIFPSYLKRYKSEFGTMKSVPVVLDCGNGAAGCIVSRLYESVGLKPTILFEEPDGQFPNHHPDPTIEKNLTQLRSRILSEGALCGIGFDGDADRIGVMDHTGRLLYGDELMVLISRDVLSNHQGAKIIGDVKCSDRLFADIEKHGGTPIMWKTGHSLIKEKIKQEKAPFGGEMSGHIFFADRNYGYDDALYAGLRVCEILSKTGKTIPELLQGLPSAYNTPEIRIDTTEEKKLAIVERLKRDFGAGSKDYSVNLIDGIRVSFEDGWALARASNTQPVLVLRFESKTETGLKKIRAQVENVVNQLL